MMTRTITLFLFMFVASLSTNSQTRLIEKVTRKQGEVTIPYEKYILSNGLTVVITEDHSDPVVHVDVTYHVGSNREKPGKSGFAHFFEHMMFQGSKHVADEQHFKIVTESGGTLNGSTNRDRTNYFETLPKNQLEIALWLEADRMGFLLDSVTQQKFEIQRATVKNERGQNYDNRPYGLAGETISRALYPQGHPYSWLTIGYVEHLDAVDVNDLKQFFMQYYGPNNATLTVGGDVDTKEVLKLAEKYFGPIPAGPKVENLPAMLPKLNDTRYISMADNVRFPMLQIVFPTTTMHGDDAAALDILTTILSEGKSSPLYQAFIKSQIANQASMYNYTTELSGELTISIRAFPEVKLSNVDSILFKTLGEWEKKGVTDNDLKRAKAQIETGFINGIESVSGKVRQLAFYQTFFSNPNRIQKELDDYLKVTVADVMNVYKKYVKDKHYVALSVYARGKENHARPDNYKNPPADVAAPHTPVKVNYKDPVDNFDRGKIPVSGPNPVIKAPVFYTELFSNGLKMYGLQQSEIPVVNMQIVIPGGHLLDRVNGNKDGLASLTARMMNESTQNYSAEAFGDEMEKLGSTISVSAGTEQTTIYVNTLVKNLERTIELLRERLLAPKFENETFERIKKQTLEGIANAYTQPVAIANNNWQKVIYGSSSILGVSSTGSKTSVESLTLNDVSAFYKSYYAPDYARIIIAGDVSSDEIIKKLRWLNDWKKSGYTLAEPALGTSYRPNVIYFIDKEKAAQSEIRVGYLAMPYDATGPYYKAGLMNYQFGGAFNSRINLNMREAKGWTYGTRSSFSGSKYPGPYTISGGFRKDATDSTIVEIIKELKDYPESISNADLEFTQRSIILREALRYETLSQKASFINTIAEFNLSPDYTIAQKKILEEIKIDELKSIAKKLLNTENMFFLVVGDKAENLEKIKQLGYSVVELDKDGVPVK